MWASGSSRLQYSFGAVITFDTTYRTNHFQSMILAGVLVRYETQESFEWGLSEFLRSMGGSPPMTILTDDQQTEE